MYIPDLSALNDGPSATVLAVGWLDVEHPFPQTQPSDIFLDALFDACGMQVRRTRGFHVCTFCSRPAIGPIQVERKGKQIFLGTAEIRVVSDQQKTFAAPTLIFHYVDIHHYAPPQEFVDAILGRKSTHS
jgi:hypothetical protein